MSKDVKDKEFLIPAGQHDGKAWPEIQEVEFFPVPDMPHYTGIRLKVITGKNLIEGGWENETLILFTWKEKFKELLDKGMKVLQKIKDS